MGAVAEGLRALGYEPTFRRPQVWRDHEDEDFQLVVTNGLKIHSRRIARAYQKRGVPVLVVDLPPIRKPGLWALWPGRINALPVSAPMNRLDLLEFDSWALGDYALVCGQKAGDAAHEMESATLADYFGRTVSMLQTKHPGKVVWRPHPEHPLPLPVETSDPDEETLDEALDGCGALVTFNSTCGIRSLELGIPTFSAHESYYRELCPPGLPALGGRDPVPDDERRCGFFARLSHVCWRESELATAEPWAETLGRVSCG